MASLESRGATSQTSSKMSQCLDYNEKILRMCGFWPEKSKRGTKRTWASLYSYISPRLSLVRMFYGTIFQLINIGISWGSLFQMAEFLIIGSVHLSIFIRVATLFFYRKRVRSMFKALESLHDPRMMPNEDMKKCLRDSENIARKLTKLLMTLSPWVVFIAQALQLVQGLMTRTLPMRLWFPYDYRSSPIFEISLFTTLFLSANDLFLMGICDITFISLLLVIIGQFKLLEHKLLHIRRYVDEKMSKREKQFETSVIGAGVRSVANTLQLYACANKIIEDSSDAALNNKQDVMDTNEVSSDEIATIDCEVTASIKKQDVIDTNQVSSEEIVNLETSAPSKNNNERNYEMETYLRHCVKHHQQLLKLSKELASIFKFLLLQTVVYSALGGFGSIYITILAPAMDVKVGAIVLLMALLYFDFFIFCWFGNQISEKAASIRDAVYACDWFGASESYKRSMRIMISRMNRPLLIKAGGLPLSVGTFRLICRAGYYSHTLLTKLFYGVKINDKRKKKVH